ncbi:MAG: nucleoside diphosphate kinase regulator [Azonexus sp.]|jgi:regulator of nucleoside diphosphate kinase|nr:nucleoside diphosphate kinase regulator [Azonexus sp.]
MQPTNLIISKEDFARLMAIHPPDDLRAELERAIIVPGEAMQAGVVTMGSRVRYAEVGTTNSREVQIVFPAEADPSKGKVSVFAPVGAALIGLTVGQEIDWDFPRGKNRLTVVEVIQPNAV